LSKNSTNQLPVNARRENRKRRATLLRAAKEEDYARKIRGDKMGQNPESNHHR
jgi:hypothetical protein